MTVAIRYCGYHSFAKDLSQCRCDSKGTSANNLCWCAGTVLTERQADTIHTPSELTPAPLWAQSSALDSGRLFHVSTPVLSMPSKLRCNSPRHCTSTAAPMALRCFFSDSHSPRGECSLRPRHCRHRVRYRRHRGSSGHDK